MKEPKPHQHQRVRKSQYSQSGAAAAAKVKTTRTSSPRGARKRTPECTGSHRLHEVGGTALLTASGRREKHLPSSASGGRLPGGGAWVREPVQGQGCSHSWEGTWLCPGACPLQLCHREAPRTRASRLGRLGRCGDGVPHRERYLHTSVRSSLHDTFENPECRAWQRLRTV